jgi:aquaporin Z
MRALAPKLLTEFVGTFVFLIVIASSGRVGSLAPLAIGLALTAMVYMGGHVSGAHYNPAVSFGLFLRGIVPVPTLVSYWVTQIAAGVLAFSAAQAIGGQTARIAPSTPWPAALSAEAIVTTALVLVVLNVAATKETRGNSFYGLAIGAIITAGAFVMGPISGGAFNPAVGVAGAFSGAVFAAGSWSDAWIYIVGPLLGGAIASGIHYLQTPPADTIQPETSEATQP